MVSPLFVFCAEEGVPSEFWVLVLVVLLGSGLGHYEGSIGSRWGPSGGRGLIWNVCDFSLPVAESIEPC